MLWITQKLSKRTGQVICISNCHCILIKFCTCVTRISVRSKTRVKCSSIYKKNFRLLNFKQISVQFQKTQILLFQIAARVQFQDKLIDFSHAVAIRNTCWQSTALGRDNPEQATVMLLDKSQALTAKSNDKDSWESFR